MLNCIHFWPLHFQIFVLCDCHHEFQFPLWSVMMLSSFASELPTSLVQSILSILYQWTSMCMQLFLTFEWISKMCCAQWILILLLLKCTFHFVCLSFVYWALKVFYQLFLDYLLITTYNWCFAGLQWWWFQNLNCAVSIL